MAARQNPRRTQGFGLGQGREAERVPGHHDLQQLLRVRHGEGRARAERALAQDQALDGEDRRVWSTSRPTICLEDLIKPHPLEDRIYRLRCVERWSMVIPWVGFPLATCSSASSRNPPPSSSSSRRCWIMQQMPGARRPVLDWPYIEGLRLDEAMHPLTILAVGLYGEYLPNQNGAPIRLVVPWKYGFKSIKSIVRIRLTDKQPMNSWQLSAPAGVRVLFEREPRARSSAMVAGARAAHWRVPDAADAHVQRLRRSGGVAVRRDGPEAILLRMTTDRRIRLVKPLVFASALVCAPGVARLQRQSHRRSARRDHERDRHLDAALRCHHARHHAIAPASGWNWLIRFRRMLGLFAFFYGSLHFLTYLIGDRFASLDFPDGFVAWSTRRAICWRRSGKMSPSARTSPWGSSPLSSMVPLALTSTAGWIRRLGGRNWQRLHRLVYLTGIAGVTHYWWKVKADTLHPAIYAVIIGVLLGLPPGAVAQAIAVAAPARSKRGA